MSTLRHAAYPTTFRLIDEGEYGAVYLQYRDASGQWRRYVSCDDLAHAKAILGAQAPAHIPVITRGVRAEKG